jgi:Asp-tRNA(Asn)/Glu-tRNA(Gln) amidotransferase A subunit family amidase
VLVAKLTLGALAMGDVWFGGMTRNPWDPKEGSSGSSAGSASAAVAGLIGFGIGSETLGSIVSPCTRCGATGLRPTFGRISRAGCMALSWSMDKLGPIARSVEDCALVFAAIHVADAQDPAAVDRPFAWPPPRDLRTMRVGYVEGRKPAEEREELKILRELGVQLVPIKLPENLPVGALGFILSTEAATAFDDITRQGVSEGLGKGWPSAFREKRFVAAVDYLRANRVRTLLMRAMDEVMRNGTRKTQAGVESPTSLTFTGRLYGETELLAVAHAYQQAVGQHLKRPPLDSKG